jgi:hypothetical protein
VLGINEEAAMSNVDQRQAVEATLREAGIPFHTLKVFGVIRLNIHVEAISKKTAARWTDLLAQAFKGGSISMAPTVWYRPGQMGKQMPKMVRGFRVCCIY